MSSVLLTVLLASAVHAPDATAEFDWLSDYGTALRQAKREQVPLLLVLEDPSAGASIEQLGGEPGETEAPLLARYKRCRIDVGTPYGKKVAAAFHVKTFPHTVIIDKTASVQIYKKTGTFTAEQWRAALSDHKQGLRRIASFLKSRWFDDEPACLT